MSHLGERLSALVDGELSHQERDRAHTHLAGCALCRSEAEAMRALKRRMRALGDVAAGPDLNGRLLKLAEPGEPLPPRPRALPGTARPRTAPLGPRRPVTTGPATRSTDRVKSHRRRAQYAVAGVFSFLVIAVGTASFVAGGDSQPSQGPRITPPVDVYTLEHALTTREVPLVGPVSDVSPIGVIQTQGP